MLKPTYHILIVFCYTLTTLAATKTPDATQTDLFKHFWNIAEVLHKIQSKAFRRVDIGTIIQAGLKAMVSKIDAHSSFFTPKSYKATIEAASGQFPGVGISLISKSVEDDSLLIVDVIRSGPADHAGIKSGDKIVEVDGHKLRGLTSDEVVAKLRGKINSKVTIKVIRDKKPLEFTVIRKFIKDKNVLSYFFPDHNATYIAIKTFSDKTPQLIKDLLEKAYSQNSTSIVLDLRKNPGGVLEAAVKTASLFLPDKTLVATTQNNKHEITQKYYTSDTPIHQTNIPLFILIDNFTASSSEILAGTLQYYAQQKNLVPAFVVGTKSFGKSSVQEIMPLSNGCALKLTNLLYFLPGDTSIQATGITPDFLVKPKVVPQSDLKWVEELYGKETSLANHITRKEVDGSEPEKEEDPIKSKDKKDLSPAELEKEYQKGLTSDHQIQFCLTLSQLYHFAQTHTPAKVKTYKDACKFLKKIVTTDTQISIKPVRT